MVSIADLSGIARDHGAPLCGAVRTEALSDHREEIEGILPEARTVVVLAAPQARGALASRNIQVAQYDTIHAYDTVARASHAAALWLERNGHRAAAVPAFIPIDMAPPKSGMRGAVDWRRAAVEAGIGGYGESGLVVTEEFGPGIRIGGLVTDAEVRTGVPPRKSPCRRCRRCIEGCPSGALSGQGRIDKKKCGDTIFSGGFRTWRRFLLDVVEAEPEGRRKLVGSKLSLDLWQNFMSGNYYYCFACQAACPLGGSPRV